jgi:hypothetical protein
MNEKTNPDFTKWVLFFIISILVVFFCSHAVVGGFTRMVADDYSVGGQVKTKGYLEGISYRYFQGGNGRYAYSVVSLALARLPSSFFPFLTGIVITVYLLAATLLFHRLLTLPPSLFGWSVAFVTVGSLIGASFISAPNLFQVLYWKIGTINYTYPVIFFLFYLYYILVKKQKAENSRLFIIPAFLIPFLNGAFNEALLAVQTTVLALWGAYEWQRNRNTLNFRMLVAGLSGSLLSLMLVLFSPATAHRQSSFPTANTLNLSQIMTKTWGLSIHFIISVLDRYTLLTMYIFLVGAILGIYGLGKTIFPKSGTTKTVIRILIFGLISLLLIIGTFATGVVGLGIEIPDRTKLIPLLVLLSGLMLQGLLVGAWLHDISPNSTKLSTWLMVPVTCLAAWLFINAALANFSHIEYLREFAHQWDERDAYIKQAADANLRVDALDYANNGGLNELRHYPEHWVNLGAAKYYGKESIIVCDRHYPDICLPAVNSDRGDMDCKDIAERNFIVKQPDPHHLDRDYNGIGCDEILMK